MSDLGLTLVGVVGFILLLFAFGMNLVGRMSRDSVTYALLNMVGGALLALYALGKDAPVFVALELIWAVTAGITLVAMLRRRGRVPTTEPLS